MSLVKAYTDGGSVKKGDDDVYHAGWGLFIEEDTDNVYRLHGACPLDDTNNRAEQLAFIRMLETALEKKWEEVLVFVDSQYVINGYSKYLANWERKKWLLSTDEPVKNKDNWMRLAVLKEKVKQAGIKIRIEWVKGHSDVHGNEMADQGATAGIALAYAGDFEERVEVYHGESKSSVVEDVAPLVKAKKTKAPKVKPPNALISGRRVLDVVNKEICEDTANVYYTVTFDDTDDIKSRGVGLAAADRFEGVVFLKEPEPILDAIHAKQTELSKEDYEVPVLYMWDKITSSKNWKRLATEGMGIVLPYRDDLCIDGKDLDISHYLKRPRLALEAISSMTLKAHLLKDVLENKADYFETINVTDLFFGKNDKGVLECHKHLAGVRRIDYMYNFKGRDTLIGMSVDYEIPNRNSFARMVKNDKEVIVDLIIHSKTKTTFKWDLMVSTPTGVGMYSNPNTNLVIVP